MIFETEGIVLKEVRLTDERKLLTIFTKNKGKIVAGTNISDKSKSRTKTSIKPFNHSRYQIYKKRDVYNINNGEIIKSFFHIGTDIDKYMHASYILELTEKIIVEEDKQQKIFNLLIDTLDALEKRKGKYMTLVIAYEIKVLKELGYMINTRECTLCTKKENLDYFSAKEGGLVCSDCAKDMNIDDSNRLIEHENLGIIKILDYFANKPIHNFTGIALDEERQKIVREIMDDFIKLHIGVEEIKSRVFI